MTFISVRHNIEVAHRLHDLPGKCENIHGHSMWVELSIFGLPNKTGVLEGLAFGDVKKKFRGFLDGTFDHHLLLNERDPWARPLLVPSVTYEGDEQPKYMFDSPDQPSYLPGLQTMSADPTTENIAKWIATWAIDEFNLPVDVKVHETHVNAAGFMANPRNGVK